MFQTVPLSIIRSCLQAVSKPAWLILLPCVQWKTPDDRQRNCLKHVEFYSKNKFEKSVHLVGFIIKTVSVLQQFNFCTVYVIATPCQYIKLIHHQGKQLVCQIQHYKMTSDGKNSEENLTFHVPIRMCDKMHKNDQTTETIPLIYCITTSKCC